MDTRIKLAGLGRVMGAMLYDGLVILGLFMIAGFIFVPIVGHSPQTSIEKLLFRLYLSLIAYVFFCWFWTHGGQTLGMRAWKIKLVDQKDETVSWPTATKRFFLAICSWLPLGLGYLWILLGSEKISWHDRLSKTRLKLLTVGKEETGSGGAGHKPAGNAQKQ